MVPAQISEEPLKDIIGPLRINDNGAMGGVFNDRVGEKLVPIAFDLVMPIFDS